MLRESFGTDNKGNSVEAVTLTNANDTQVKVSTFGATIVSFIFTDKAGVKRDVVLGYDNAEGYASHEGYFGATVGRSAGRIEGARIIIDGVEYTLDKNDGNNNLHSGKSGVSDKIFTIDQMDDDKNSVTMKYVSADDAQDFPGTMTMKIIFTLTADDALHIDYEAVSDKDTVANFTNHSYFNLAGHDGGYVGSQKLKIYADQFAPIRPVTSIPTGELWAVDGTPFDFKEFKEIGKDIDADYEQLQNAKGYDHCYKLPDNGNVELFAEAVCDDTGIHMYAYTDAPGVLLYTGNYIDERTGKGGAVYHSRHAFCLETQYFPNAVNEPAFKSPILKANDVYKTTTVYRLALDSEL